MKIFKYPIGMENVRHEHVIIPMPAGAIVLSAASQAGSPVIWAMVNEDAQSTENREFLIRMTGEEFQSRKRERFIGTILLQRDSFVLHIFEVQ